MRAAALRARVLAALEARLGEDEAWTLGGNVARWGEWSVAEYGHPDPDLVITIHPHPEPEFEARFRSKEVDVFVSARGLQVQVWREPALKDESGKWTGAGWHYLPAVETSGRGWPERLGRLAADVATGRWREGAP